MKLKVEVRRNGRIRREFAEGVMLGRRWAINRYVLPDHTTLPDDKRGWTVTHIQSGKALKQNMQYSDAVALFKRAERNLKFNAAPSDETHRPSKAFIRWCMRASSWTWDSFMRETAGPLPRGPLVIKKPKLRKARK